MAKQVFKAVGDYDAASPYRSKVAIALTALAGSSAIGTSAAALTVSVTRLDAGAFAAEIVHNDKLIQSAAVGSVKAAVEAAMAIGGFPIKSYGAVDYKAITWPEAEVAGGGTKKTKAKAAAEGDNEVFFFDVEGVTPEKEALEAATEAVVLAFGDVQDGQNKTLVGHHRMATAYTTIRDLFTRLEGEGDHSTRGLRRWVDTKLASVPAMVEAVKTKNGGGRWLLMASLPLELCQRMGVGTPSMIESRYLSYRKSYIQEASETLVVLEGDAFDAEAADCAGAFKDAVAKDKAKHEAKRDAAEADRQKHMQNNSRDLANKAWDVLEEANKALLASDVITALMANEKRLAAAADDVKAAAIARSKAMTAAAAEAAAAEAAETAKAAEAAAAKVKVSSGFAGQATQEIAATLLAMIWVEGVDTDGVINALGALYDREAAKRDAAEAERVAEAEKAKATAGAQGDTEAAA